MRTHVGLACVFLLGGCIPIPRVRVVAPDAVYMVRDHYRVEYAAAAERELLGPDWLLEEVGTRSAARGDRGEPFDLRFVHRRDRSLIFAQTTPVRPEGTCRRAIGSGRANR